MLEKLFSKKESPLSEQEIEKLLAIPVNRSRLRAKLFAPPETEVALKHVYTDKQGNNFFEYENPLEMPKVRMLAGEISTRYMAMNLTKEELLRLLTEAEHRANKGNIVELFSIIKEIKDRAHYLAEENSLMQLATVYFLMEGEDPKLYDKATQRRKMALWNQDEEMKGFFLQKAWDQTHSFTESSQINIPLYLEMMKAQQSAESTSVES